MNDAFAISCNTTAIEEPDCGQHKTGQTQDTETSRTLAIKSTHSLMVFAVMVMEINTQRMNYKMYSAVGSV